MLPGIIGTLQANEVIKLILGIGTPAIGKLTTFAAMDLEFKTFKLRRDPTCPVCGDHPTITEPIDYEQFCGVPILDPKSAGRNGGRSDATPRCRPAGERRPPARRKRAARPDPGRAGCRRATRSSPDWEVTPREVKSLLDKGEPFLFIDCRLPNEYAITHIDGAKLIPLQQIGQRFGELQGHEDEKVIVHCKSGGRSMQFAQILRQNGFKDVKSMAGGILLWNKDINPGGPQY